MEFQALRIAVPSEAIDELRQMYDLIVEHQLTVTVEIQPDELTPFTEVTKAMFIRMLIAAKDFKGIH